MLRSTQDVSEVRAWCQTRGGWPCRQLDGRLDLGFPGEECRGLRIGWDEFEALFVAGRLALFHEGKPGSTRFELVSCGRHGGQAPEGAVSAGAT